MEWHWILLITLIGATLFIGLLLCVLRVLRHSSKISEEAEELFTYLKKTHKEDN